MKGHGAKFGRKQEEATAALLTQRNIDEAANGGRHSAQHAAEVDEAAGVRYCLLSCKRAFLVHRFLRRFSDNSRN
jgi:hypothetical protein